MARLLLLLLLRGGGKGVAASQMREAELDKNELVKLLQQYVVRSVGMLSRRASAILPISLSEKDVCALRVAGKVHAPPVDKIIPHNILPRVSGDQGFYTSTDCPCCSSKCSPASPT